MRARTVVESLEWVTREGKNKEPEKRDERAICNKGRRQGFQ